MSNKKSGTIKSYSEQTVGVGTIDGVEGEILFIVKTGQPGFAVGQAVMYQEGERAVQVEADAAYDADSFSLGRGHLG